MTEVMEKCVHKYVCTYIYDTYMYIFLTVFGEVRHFVQSVLHD